MRNILATIAVLLSVCANAQYSEMLHAYITPTNKVVTSIPDWVKGAADYYTFGFRKDGSINGFLSFAHGTNVVASGDFSFASGKSTLASAESSHAEGNGTIASGFASHAEGCTTIAKGNCSHSEGRYTTANGTYSHSSGVSSLASNNYSFVWSGVLPPTNPNDQNNKYGSNGEGTFNVNPIGGVNGFYIGNSNLKDIIQKDSGMKFNMIVPITNNQNVVFNPIDGASNWLNSKMTVNPIRVWGDCTVLPSFWRVDFYDPDTLDEVSLTITGIFENCKVIEVYYSVIYGETTIYLMTTGINHIFNDQDDEVVGEIPSNTLFLCKVIGNIQLDSLTENPININLEYSDLSSHIIWEEKYSRLEFNADDIRGSIEMTYKESSPIRYIYVSIPVTANSTKARHFSLAVESDTDSEKDIIWQGGDIIESFPGASKLVPGYVVWNVNEVAPGKLLVNRSPMNISSSSDVTIKGDNGNDYTLNIDENGVLEVRNK